MTIKSLSKKIALISFVALPLVASAQMGNQGTMYPMGAPMPQAGMPGGMMMGPQQPQMGEVPAYGQPGGNGCSVDRNGDTRIVNTGGVPGPMGPGGH
jgi:hypothetical protein